MSYIVVMRDIDIVTTEIKTIEMQVAKAAIYGCIEIGKRLVEAKEMVGHGGWGKYLEEKVRYSQQWATNLMNLYKEYGGAQESLFESFANSQSFGNIDVTKHILLLAVPTEERAAFAEEHDAENSTVKELQAAIRERDAAREQMYQQAAKMEQADCKVAELTVMIDEANAELNSQKAETARLQAQAAEATGKVDKLNERLKKALDAEKAAKAALQKAKENPVIPEAMMEEMRQQVAADAAEKATAEIKAQLEAAQIAAKEAEQRRADAEARVAEAEKKIQLANPDMVLVSTYLSGVQEQFNKMLGALKKVKLADPETGEKLKANVRSKLLESLQKAIDAV